MQMLETRINKIKYASKLSVGFANKTDLSSVVRMQMH